MVTANYQFGRGATFLAASLVASREAVGVTILKSKLGAIVFQLHLSVLHVWAMVESWLQWWPLLLIMAGVGFLLKSWIDDTQLRDARRPRFTEGQKGDQ